MMWPFGYALEDSNGKRLERFFFSPLLLIQHKFNDTCNSKNTPQEVYPELERAIEGQ